MMSNRSLALVSVHDDAQSTGENPTVPAPCGPIGFGEFIAFPASRMLMRRGARVDLGSRAFDLLMVLLRARGTLVTRHEIVRQVWPSTNVDESNLRFQMACLRKALGTARDYIKTIPGRGYMFIGDDENGVRTEQLAEARRAPEHARPGDSPAIFVIDRDDVIRAALERLLRSFDVRVASFVSVEALLESTIVTRAPPGPAGQGQARIR